MHQRHGRKIIERSNKHVVIVIHDVQSHRMIQHIVAQRKQRVLQFMIMHEIVNRAHIMCM